ncbi:MAG: antibiotic biosynthesis monooxygenase [bacterium]|nr:antibiotic biosynthesis monooxygenase [bacterium]
MIVRIVKMTFRDDTREQFHEYTKTIAETIHGFDGCEHLDILQCIHDKNIFFSYSHWQSEHHLNQYRYSDFFKKTWSTVRLWFGDKPEAWSVEEV